jgi:hypothetical protein
MQLASGRRAAFHRADGCRISCDSRLEPIGSFYVLEVQMKTPSTRQVIPLLFVLASVPLFAEDIPLTNWTVPPYHRSSASGGVTTMTDLTPGIGFVGVAPCRLVDTRQAGFPAGYGQPALAAGAPRDFDLNSQPNCTGIPAGVDAYSLNFTVTNTQGPGFLKVYPQGGSVPLDVSTINYVGGQTIANAAIVPAGTGGGVTVIAGVSGTDLVMDINGYFTDQYNPGVSFHAVSSTVAPAILAENTSQVNGAFAIQAVITSTAPGGSSAAVRGINNNNTNNNGIGVWGSHAGAGWGVLGASQTGVGVFGETFGSIGFGVAGQTASEADGNAGVIGADGSGTTSEISEFVSGVRGESRSHNGVLGITENGFLGTGVWGKIAGSSASGILGYEGLIDYGVFSIGPAYVTGDLSVVGNFSSANKWFIQPHPYDAAKEIRYVSLEGPHAEVYFRGTAQISQGITRIPIPQDFRFVADPETYSTLVTPVGGMATVAVLSEGEAGIVVQASRDVRIHYVVYAERSAIKNPEPIVENVDFRPGRDQNNLAYVPDSYRRLLIQNGTLNSDGSINMETARRLGWDKEWEKRTLPAPQPNQE